MVTVKVLINAVGNKGNMQGFYFRGTNIKKDYRSTCECNVTFYDSDRVWEQLFPGCVVVSTFCFLVNFGTFFR